MEYDTADDAAIAFGEENYSASRYIYLEFGAIIYSRTINGITTYDYTDIVVGTHNRISLDNVQVPYGTTPVATVHTHPVGSEVSGTELGTSYGDVNKAAYDSLNAYVIVADPQNTLNFKIGKVDIANRSLKYDYSIKPIELTFDQKVELLLYA